MGIFNKKGESCFEAENIVKDMEKLFAALKNQTEAASKRKIDKVQFVLLLGGVSVCRKIPGIHKHMGYEELYVCESEEDKANVKAHLQRMYGIENKDDLLAVCNRMYSSDEDYLQFETFWEGKPAFDVKQLNDQGRETFEACKSFAKLFEPLVKHGGFFAWDCNERIGLLRAAHACDILSEEDFWELTVPLSVEAATRYDSWMEFAISCLCGSVYFMFCQCGMKEDGTKQFYEINRQLIVHLLDKDGAWGRNEWFTYETKKFLKGKDDIVELLKNWEGPEGCIATDRIVVDGCKVGYMYREQTENEWDSGWRFMAGDESEEYMNNADNSGIYALNTICNYDKDIMNFLSSPYGNAFFRDDDGEFKWEQLGREEKNKK
ncbi:MAG: DUF2185 domain-containing protein [Lachnospiraceae bacterium]|nr:DUF2185 domain-containing protein [Lachnospiraceae bacterium]